MNNKTKRQWRPLSLPPGCPSGPRVCSHTRTLPCSWLWRHLSAVCLTYLGLANVIPLWSHYSHRTPTAAWNLPASPPHQLLHELWGQRRAGVLLNKPSSVQFSRSVVSDSSRPHGPQHARPPCPSPTPGVYSNSSPLSRWCHPTSHPLSSPSPPTFSLSQHQGLFKELALRIRWPKYWSLSFNVSPSNEHSGLISFRMDWLGLLAF